MTNVWFNHWFTTAYHLMGLIQESGADIRLIGSSHNEHSVYRLRCHEWHMESKDIPTSEYPDFCLDFCKEHDVNVFVPRRGLTEIIKRADDFEKLGVKLYANTNVEHVGISDDKVKTYRYIEENGFGAQVPPYFCCTNADEFAAAVDELRSQGLRVCYKLAVDEGALTFRVMSSSYKPSIYENSPYHISYDNAALVMSEYSFKIPVLVMPYLDGPEVSVDCLKTDHGLLMLPRYKTANRFYMVDFDEKIMEKTRGISDIFDFEMPYNIQYRMFNGEPVVLEINPRMSGGLQVSCAASEINLPGMAMRKLLGRSTCWEYPEFKSRSCVQLESPISTF